MKTKQIEFLVPWKDDGIDYEVGDRKSFPLSTCEFFCEAGVAKDLSGEIETKPINPHKKVVMQVDNVKVSTKLETK